MPIDLDGFEPGNRDLKLLVEYLETRQAGVDNQPDSVLGEGVQSALALAQAASSASWAAVFGVLVALKRPVSWLLRLLSSPARPAHLQPADALQLLLDEVTRRGLLVLHVPSTTVLPDTLGKLLFDLALLNPRLTLAFSIGRDTPTDAVVHVGASLARSLRIEFRTLDYETAQRRLAAHHVDPPPSWIVRALFESSAGHPALLAARLQYLAKQGHIEFLGDTKFAFLDTPELAVAMAREPIGQLTEWLRSLPGLAEGLSAFLFNAALCGPIVPAGLVLQFVTESSEEAERLLEALEQGAVIGDCADPPVPFLVDITGDHPGAPDTILYAFRSLPQRLALLTAQSETRDRAAALLAYLLARMGPTSRTAAQIVLNVAEHAGDHDLAALRERLRWWVGADDADALERLLAHDVRTGSQDPEPLWLAVRASRWNAPQQRLALVNAYACQPDGIPVTRAAEFAIQRAECLSDLGDFSAALADGRNALRHAQRSRDGFAETVANYVVGSALLALQKPADAIDFLSASVRLFRAASCVAERLSPAFFAAAMHAIGRCRIELGEHDVARQALEQARATLLRMRARDAVAERALAATLNELGLCFPNDPATAVVFFQEAAQRFSVQNQVGRVDHHAVGLAHYHVARCQKALGDYVQSAATLTEAISCLNRGDEHGRIDHHTIAGAMLHLGRYHREQGRPAEAIGFFEDGLKAVKAGNRHGRIDHNRVGILLRALARCYRDQGDRPRAMQLFHQALEAAERGGFGGAIDHQERSVTLRELARCALDDGDFSQAKQHYEAALSAAQQGDEYGVVRKASVGFALHGIGCCYLRQGNAERAREWLLSALEPLRCDGRAETETSQNDVGRAIFDAAMCALQLGQQPLACDLLEEALVDLRSGNGFGIVDDERVSQALAALDEARAACL